MGRSKHWATVLAALVTQLALAAPAAASGSDSFASATDLSAGNPYPADFGTNFGASREVGEPQIAGNAGGASLWLKWTPSLSAQATVHTCDQTSFDSLLGVYVANNPLAPAVNDLTEIAASDDGCGSADTGSRATFATTSGTTYYIAIDGSNGGSGAAQGTYNLLTGPTPGNDTFAGSTLTTSVPSPVAGTTVFATTEPGEPSHAGNQGGSSVWYSWTPSAGAAGRVTVGTCSSSGNADTLLAVYTDTTGTPGVNSLTPVASDDNGCGLYSQVRFAAGAGTTYRIAVDAKSNSLHPAGETGPFTLSFEPTPANDDLADAETISSTLPQTVAGSTAGATAEPGELGREGVPATHSVWYEWTASSNVTVTAATCTSAIDTAVGVYTGGAHPLTEVAADDGSCGTGGTRGSVSFNAVSGITYLIGVDGQEGSFSLDLSEGDSTPPPAPVINGSTPASPADDNSPEISGSAEAGSTVRLYTNASCTGTPAAAGSAAQFSSPGLTVSVADNSVTEIRATAVDSSSNVSACSAPLSYTEQSAGGPGPGPDTTVPQTVIDSAPRKVKTKGKKARATFRFSADEAGARFECRLDRAAFKACSSPHTLRAKTGKHTFAVRAIDAAGNADASPAIAKFKVKRKHRR